MTTTDTGAPRRAIDPHQAAGAGTAAEAGEATEARVAHRAADTAPVTDRPWRALWALVIGFFMILVDTTIVSVAMPKIMSGLHTDLNNTVWVTSAYLLAYAVPLLIMGRLGDRIGPKTLYLAGLATFTLASLWCGLSGSIGMLITARVVQGLGAATMTPQTMSVITRLFPPKQRAQAMSVWGATAGVAMLAGPLLGGLLTDAAGWEWIFFINLPIGLAGFVFAAMAVPTLPIHSHKFDWLGVVLSAVATFLLVFGIQEGESHKWGTFTDDLTVGGLHTHLPVTIPGLIIAGVVVFALFIAWQAVNRREPLVPLGLFRDRSFSAANIAILVMGFAVTCTSFPLMLYYQLVRGLTPTQSALTMLPMAGAALVMAPIIGGLSTRINPKWIAITGFVVSAASQFIAWRLIKPDTPILMFLIPLAVLGLGNSMIWGPLSITATRHLPPQLAGAGSGVYNTTRQMGSVLGSASIAALMTQQTTKRIGDAVAAIPPQDRGRLLGNPGPTGLPAALHDAYSAAMATSLLLPGALLLLGVVAALFFPKPPAEHMHR